MVDLCKRRLIQAESLQQIVIADVFDLVLEVILVVEPGGICEFELGGKWECCEEDE